MNFINFVARVFAALVFAIPMCANAAWTFHVQTDPVSYEKETYALSEETDNALMGVLCDSDGLRVSVGLKKRTLYTSGELLMVQVRFDKRAPFHMQWRWLASGNGLALDLDAFTAVTGTQRNFINGLRKYSTLLVEEPKGKYEDGGEFVEISLRGSAKAIDRVLRNCDRGDLIDS